MAIESRKRLDHLLGPVGAPGHHQCGERIERVEKEMRVYLIAQTAQFGGLGCGAESLLAALRGLGLRTRQQREIERGPGEQQEIASQRNIGQLLPAIHPGRRWRQHQCARRGGRTGIARAPTQRHGSHGGHVHEQIASVIAVDGDTLILTDFLGDLILHRFEQHAVDLSYSQRRGQRGDQRDCDLGAKRSGLDQPDYQPQQQGDGGSSKADQATAPDQLTLHRQVDQRSPQADEKEIAQP